MYVDILYCSYYLHSATIRSYTVEINNIAVYILTLMAMQTS